VNGVLAASNTGIDATGLSNSNSTYSFWQSGMNINDENPAFNRGWVTAYMKDLRIYDTVKYTGNFIVGSVDPDILPDTPSGVAGGSTLTKIIDGAVAFDGSGDYLNVAATDEFTFGTGDFTIETFIYHNTLGASGNTIIDFRNAPNNTDAGALWKTSGGEFGWYVNGANRVTGATVAANKWYHLALVRNSGTTSLYVDGISVGSFSDSYDYATKSGRAFIGALADGTDTLYLDGFISNFRIIKGTALYTSNFTPSTSALTNVTNTKLLCAQSNTSATAAAVAPGSITIPSNGYDFKYAKIYSVYDGLRSANYTVQYSDNNSTWTNAWSGVMSNNSSCGIQQGSGSGSQGPRRYWRYVEGSAVVGHHPRVSRIILSDGVNDVDIVTYTSDNCSDTGTYQVGTTSSYEDTTWVTNVANNPKVSNFNPFTTDINAVRGQESGWCTLNAVVPTTSNGRATLSNNNLSCSVPRLCAIDSTFGVTSGKFYWEVKATDLANSPYGMGIFATGSGITHGGLNYVILTSAGGLYTPGDSNNQGNGWGPTYNGSTDIIGLALDMDNHTLGFNKNGGSFTTYDFSAYISSNDMSNVTPCWKSGGNLGTSGATFNFGQKPFKYNPPEGSKTLCLANLPRPTKAAVKPDKYFKTLTYAGNGATNTPITGLGFQPDLVWVKGRTTTC
jgi:hypothetical protein